jgi:CBS domain containing-hemolysin-like protein
MTTLEYILLALSLLLSAFFSGMEIAFVSSSKLHYEVNKADRSIVSRMLGTFYRHPYDYISCMLVGNNAVLVVFSILMARLLDPLFIQAFPSIPETVLLIVDSLVSTGVVLLFGEFLPKTLFRINPNATMRVMSLPTWFFFFLLWPFARFASMCARLVLRLFGVRVDNRKSKSFYTKIDLDDFIESSIGSGGETTATEVQIFQNALDFVNIRVRDCMIPRNEIAAVDKDCTPDELVRMFVDTGYSKIVVYDSTVDNIIGYIHSSELFKSVGETDITRYAIRRMPIVPETASAHKLMKEFMQKKLSLAVVVDEFGGTAGIVSLEDIVEELTGDIEDEHDTARFTARQTADGQYILSARLETEKVNAMFGLQLPLSDEYNTIGGLILSHHQSIPAIHQIITVPGGFEFKILKAGRNKINLVMLKTE